MRLLDLARAIAPEARHEFTGIRPGEKLGEVLLTAEEARHAREYPDRFIIYPETPLWAESGPRGGHPLADGFEYASDKNDRWVSVDEIRRWIGDLQREGSLEVA